MKLSSWAPRAAQQGVLVTPIGAEAVEGATEIEHREARRVHEDAKDLKKGRFEPFSIGSKGNDQSLRHPQG